MNNLDVIVMGAINMDILVHVDQYPKYGANVPAKNLEINVGGKGSNQAVAVAKQHVNQTLIGSIGNDDFGKQILSSLENSGVKTDHLIIKDDVQTGTAVAAVDNTGENTFMVVLGANNSITSSDIDAAMKNLNAKVFLVNLETSQESVLAALKIAKSKDMYIVLDPAPENSYFEESLKYADVVTPNKQETERITGVKVETIADGKKAAKIIANKGVKNVIVKLGESGNVLYESEKDLFTIIKATRVKAVNTVGAGDTFAGVLSAHLAKNPNNLVEAIEIASKAAAIKVSRSGGHEAIPTLEEINQFEY
ncbi:ribokinase [Bombilactobacillus bombi]|uniref:ribokinase n=1 Tax=Bombilactobacillus bombi TaxID=1303590 RepID=UPI0035E97491